MSTAVKTYTCPACNRLSCVCEMEIDRDTYDALPVERVPKDEPARSEYQSRQLVAALQMLSTILSAHPEIERSVTNFQRDQAKPIYCIRDAAGTDHWTFKNPNGMGS